MNKEVPIPVAAEANWYEKNTSRSSNWIKRFAHTNRYQKAVEILDPKPGETLLDFGTGDGEMLAQLNAREPRARYTGYEPFDKIFELASAKTAAIGGTVTAVHTLDALKGQQFDKISCLEVLEHLIPYGQSMVLDHCWNLMSPGGMLLVSVPIEIGPVAVFKAAIRARAGHRSEASLKDTLYCAIGRPEKVVRESGSYIFSHVGFDYRLIPGLLETAGFKVERIDFTPFPAFKGLLNSQVFFRGTKVARQ